MSLEVLPAAAAITGVAIVVAASVTDGFNLYSAGTIDGTRVLFIVDNNERRVSARTDHALATNHPLTLVDSRTGDKLDGSELGFDALVDRTVSIVDLNATDGCAPTSFRLKYANGDLEVSRVSTTRAVDGEAASAKAQDTALGACL